MTVYDPDAPSGSGWWHLSVVNIPASVTKLASNSGDVDDAGLSKGAVQLRTDYGAAAWGGMCPPQGDKPHRYVFTVYAMKTEKVVVPAAVTGASMEPLLAAGAMGKASFTAKYGRAKEAFSAGARQASPRFAQWLTAGRRGSRPRAG